MNSLKQYALAIACATALTFAPWANAEDAEGAAPADPGPAPADDLTVTKSNTLDELLQNVEQRRVVESPLHIEREARFLRDEDQRSQMLNDAGAERGREEELSESLEARFEENETRIVDLTERLDRRLGSLRELFGVLQQVARDTRDLFEGSIISVQYPDRGDWLGALAGKMGTSGELATIEEMEQLWFELQREMTESARVVKFPASITMLSGRTEQKDVVRVGSFAVVSDDGYVQYDVEAGALVELARQPGGRYTSATDHLFDAGEGEVVEFRVDPTRGSLLALLIDADTWADRVGSPLGGITMGECWLPWCDGQGGWVGSVIILIGIVGVLLGIERLITLSLISAKVNAQKSTTPNTDNPLGRVLKVFDEHRDFDLETLELKLGEAVLAQTPGLTRNIRLIHVIAIVAPLLGLLGTVEGVISTFEAITLFGTGDPKTMAGSISQALVTTVLGLVVSITTMLLYSVVAARSRNVIHVIEEQTAGIIASHAEAAGKPLG